MCGNYYGQNKHTIIMLNSKFLLHVHHIHKKKKIFQSFFFSFFSRKISYFGQFTFSPHFWHCTIQYNFVEERNIASFFFWHKFIFARFFSCGIFNTKIKLGALFVANSMLFPHIKDKKTKNNSRFLEKFPGAWELYNISIQSTWSQSNA